ncbi:MAG: response regulator transcription factor [Anaerolineales bacterium]|nr:response regulator transcription factor [Anaerolineales bacterium]
MSEKIKVTILDDHPSIIDGYRFRLSNSEDIEIVATANYGDDLDQMLKDNPCDVLLLDIGVPTSKENENHYPVLHEISKIKQIHPHLVIVVISMFSQRTLIRTVMESGASGYILKDDRDSIETLGEIIVSLYKGGVYLSKEPFNLITQNTNQPDFPPLTPRQQQVLSLCASHPEDSTNELADRLNIASSTVRNLLSNIYMRLDVPNRQSAVMKAQQLGIITPDHPPLKS